MITIYIDGRMIITQVGSGAYNKTCSIDFTENDRSDILTLRDNLIRALDYLTTHEGEIVRVTFPSPPEPEREAEPEKCLDLESVTQYATRLQYISELSSALAKVEHELEVAHNRRQRINAKLKALNDRCYAAERGNL